MSCVENEVSIRGRLSAKRNKWACTFLVVFFVIDSIAQISITMAGNKSLNAANKAKEDEFYTELSDIENELKHYKQHFKGKTVLCNCDDPRISNFFHYFSHNFEALGLKKLITTCYKSQERDLFSSNDSERAIWLEYNGDRNGNRVPDPEEIGIHYLNGDGDFRSPECIELLKEADIVVGDIQPLGISMSFGGPHAGYMACKEAYMRQLPGRLVGSTLDADGNRAYTLTIQTREQHIKREKATSNICSNQSLIALSATLYLSLLGEKGFVQTGIISANLAHLLSKRLSEIGIEVLNKQSNKNNRN